MLRNAYIAVCVIALTATVAHAQTKHSGSGPYQVIMEGNPGISGHTIYRPEKLSEFNGKNPLPIFAWVQRWLGEFKCLLCSFPSC
jgi:hypothetical protein